MPKLVHVKSIFTEVKKPRYPILREENEVEIEILQVPKRLIPPPRNKQRILITIRYNFKVFMRKVPTEISSTYVHYDIITYRDLYLMELYRVVVSVIERFRIYIFTQKLPFMEDEDFPVPPPDVIRTILLPVLNKINEVTWLRKVEMN